MKILVVDDSPLDTSSIKELHGNSLEDTLAPEEIPDPKECSRDIPDVLYKDTLRGFLEGKNKKRRK